MKVDTLNVNYIIDGTLKVKPTKMFYEQLDEDKMQNIHFKIQLNNQHIYSNSSNSTEYAIKYLQKELPDNISIACCQSCRHGNFNPYGDMENQVFCLKDKTPRNRDEVVEIFSKQDKSLERRIRKLLDFCKDYKPISPNEKYTYNDWGLEKLS
ncbi:hypothetical protein [Neobacillus sp. NPDC093127]|uniref:hypothetical protein n=1 Tax=Neobacillus sp. NPDC093127 TaxID=3364296 RepID=UPI003802A448